MQCKKCGEEIDRYPCPSCGHIEFGILQLEGSQGRTRMTISTVVGKRNLFGVLSPDEKNCFAESQFWIYKSETAGGWTLIPCPGTPNDTSINGSPAPASTETPISNGDVIAVSSKRDSSIVRGQLTVSILNAES